MDSENKSIENARCLNCGATLYEGNFCHICGQPANTGRLTTKNMGVVILSSLTRINKHFLHTIKCLMLRPWKVIADYINGKRVAYTAPVQLLIVLAFLVVALNSLIGEDMGLKGNDEHFTFLAGDGVLVSGINSLFRTIASSLTLIFLLMLIPAVPVLQLVHRMAGIRKYNLAEYIVGALYVSCFILAADLVSLPLDLLDKRWLGTEGNLSLYVEGGFTLVILLTALYRSMASSKRGKVAKWLLILLFFVLCCLFYMFIFVAVYVVHDISMHGLGVSCT